MGYTSGSNAKLRASTRLRVVPPCDDEDDDDSDGEDEKVFSILPVDPTPAPTPAPAGDEDDDEEGGDKEASGDSDAETTEADTDSTPIAAKGPPPLPAIFGVLAPPSLREAQASAIQSVQIIAELAGVEVKMRGVEVEVRRARKRALKAERGR
jgi:hypothetical protein